MAISAPRVFYVSLLVEENKLQTQHFGIHAARRDPNRKYSLPLHFHFSFHSRRLTLAAIVVGKLPYRCYQHRCSSQIVDVRLNKVGAQRYTCEMRRGGSDNHHSSARVDGLVVTAYCWNDLRNSRQIWCYWFNPSVQVWILSSCAPYTCLASRAGSCHECTLDLYWLSNHLSLFCI